MPSKWKIAAMALGAFLMFAGTSYAQDTTENTEAEEEAVDTRAELDETICRRVHVTGTRIPQRYCLKRSEWARMREEAQEELDRNATGANTVTGGGDG